MNHLIGIDSMCAAYSKIILCLPVLYAWFVSTQMYFINVCFKPANSPALADFLVHVSGVQAVPRIAR